MTASIAEVAVIRVFGVDRRVIRIGTYVEDAKLTGPPKVPTSAHFAVLKSEITLATARNAPREDRLKVKPDGAPSSKLKRCRVDKHAAIGAPILSLIRCV